MKWKYLSLISILAIFLQISLGCNYNIKQAEHSHYIPQEIIITFEPGVFADNGDVIPDSLKRLNNRFQLKSIEHIANDTYLLRLASRTDIERVAEEYLDNEFVINAEPNYRIRAVDENTKGN